MILGFGLPNDFCAMLFRALLAKKYGIFGRVPCWNGVKLHRFYPPLTTLLVMNFNISGTLVLYFVLTALSWMILAGPITALLFTLSFFHVWITAKVGRLPESFSFLMIFIAFSSQLWFPFLTLAILFHPIGLIVGLPLYGYQFLQTLMTGNLANILWYLGMLLCSIGLSGFWLIPFLAGRRQLNFFGDKRHDKLLGVYFISYLSFFNMLFFMFVKDPIFQAIFFTVSSLGYLLFTKLRSKIMFLRRRIVHVMEDESNQKLFYRKFIYTVDDIPEEFPKINTLNQQVMIVLTDNGDQFNVSYDLWTWACACYLLAKKNIVVFNGLAATEVPKDQLFIPDEVHMVRLDDLR